MSDWSAAEDRRLMRMWCADEPPRSTREIADELDRSKSSVDRRIGALGLRGHKGDRAEYERQTGVALAPAIRPVRVEAPARPTGKPVGPDYTMLVWADVHFPFQDDSAISVLRQIARDLDPDKIICLGDVFDFFEISDYRAPADKEPDMQETLNLGVQHLEDMLEITQPSEAYFMGGNHEDRWDRLLQRAQRDIRFRQLLQLPKIKRALDFAEVVGFEDLGYEYSPYTEGWPLIENDMLVMTHGDLANKYVARTTMEKYGRSVIFGHMHRIQNYTKRDLKGQEAGWCIGCLSTLDPHYDPFANWQQGFAIVTWSTVGGRPLYNVEQVRIHSGSAIWRGQTYSAT